MPIDAKAVKWDAPAASAAKPAAIDAAAVTWDAPAAPAAAAPAVGTLEGAGMGLLRGAKDVVDTGAKFLAKGFDKIAGTNQAAGVEAMNKAGTQEFDAQYGGSAAAAIGRVGGQIAATLPVGGALGAVAKGGAALGVAPRVLAPLGDALATGGVQGGSMATRVAGGAITGGASAGLVDSESAGAGAAIGAALPVAVRGLGAVGKAIGGTVRGPVVPDAQRAAVQAAQDAGYVLPPSQAKPTMLNRALEGFAGKLTTAQNASARNQGVTNDLAAKAIGAADLSPQSIAAVRSNANKAYDTLGKSAPFQADDAFRAELTKVGGGSAQMRKDFPELVNSEVEGLVAGLSGRGEFNAQSTIEAIKQLRYSGGLNRAGIDPGKKALGASQMKTAAALEDLIDRNLAKSGNADLLAQYRTARQTLAKTYDVEKALNPASGNIDAAQLAKLLKKGRPLTGELKTAASVASAFPKATQAVDKMGSLPQSSPLDWAAAAGIGAAGGGPFAALGLVGRPAARAAALSPFVQRGLASAPSAPLTRLLPGPGAASLLSRAPPVALANRDR